ncbi:MAG: hypothetical protein ABIC95_06060 [archaeon]
MNAAKKDMGWIDELICFLEKVVMFVQGKKSEPEYINIEDLPCKKAEATPLKKRNL